ncbi:MAG: winged helix-turn-helix domain-containing protein [Candidatus Bathyarchaeota archaeon]|nr:winged helix-turn-helix domain-containing protein [Candidatus Bathyarchaeota archaeon]
MGKYRDRLQIVADMLSVVSGNNDAKKTRIMYLANLSWDLLNRYLNDLMEAGLLSFDSSGSGCYVLTSRGKRFLCMFSGYCKRCEKVEDHLNDLDKEKRNLENMIFNAKELDEK